MIINQNLIDLRGYSNQELSLEVYNCEYLYFLIDHENVDQPALMHEINQQYLYNGSQFDVLMEDIESDISEWRVNHE